MYRSLIAIAFIFLSVHCHTQQPLYNNYKWFRVEDGLPQSFISGLQQDKDGFLWIGTRDGLARYDGREFRIFRQENNDSLSLSYNVITDLFLDAQNLLWIFYVNEKVDCFDPAKQQVVYKDSFRVARKLLAETKVKKFLRDQSGRFWFNAHSKGLFAYDPATNTTTRYHRSLANIISDSMLNLGQDAAGKIFVFTDKGIEFLKTRKNETAAFFPYNNNIRINSFPRNDSCTTALPDGRLVMASLNRLIVFNPTNNNFNTWQLPDSVPPKEGIIQQIARGNDALLYIVAAGGVYRFEKNNRFTWLWQSDKNNRFAGDAKAFIVDRSGVAWFGTNAMGMYKLNLQSIPFHSKPYAINFPFDVLSQLPGFDNSRLPSFNKEPVTSGIRYAYDTRHGLWFTHRDNGSKPEPLSVYYANNNRVNKVPAPAGMHAPVAGLGITSAGIYAMDIYGNTWQWENNHVLPVFHPGILSFEKQSKVLDMEADENIFWVATSKEGLYKIENNKVTGHFSTESVAHWPANQLTAICNDPSDRNILWIGTLGYGLIRFNKAKGTASVISTGNGLPNNTVYCIVPDDNGNLWLSTNKGVSRFSIGTNQFSNFDVRDGLPGNEFNRFHQLRFPDGRIAFGGPEGTTIFDPAAFAKDSFPTSVALTRLLINNKPVEFTGNKNELAAPLNELDRLTLPYNKNFLQFEFAGLQFNQPEKTRYRYMLKGYDKEWIVSGPYNIAGYTRLPPGRYTLLVNASNTSGEWSPVVKQLAIRIRPPAWATWWAYTLYALVALLLFRTYWKYRHNRIRMQHDIVLEQNKAKHLKEVDEIKDRFFSNITHELRTPLTLILTPLEKLKNENTFTATDQHTLTTAHKNAEHLLRLINQLLDISKMESGQMKVKATIGDLAEFTETSVLQFYMQASEKQVTLGFSSDNITGLYFFDEEKWEKIVFNLVSNAIKFTGAHGTINVTLAAMDEMVRLSVADAGKGIASVELPKLFDRFYMADDSATKQQGGTGIGLALVKELVELMNGNITVQSNPGTGSVFTVTVPLLKAGNFIIPKEKEIKESRVVTVREKKEKPLLLVIEDNEELLSFLTQSLSDNWRVIKAANGLEGWELALQELPDLIVSDVMMPGMDGFELCQKIKDDPRTGHISVILLTAKTARESRLAGLQKGADVYLSKPFHFDELELRLQNLVKQQERLMRHLRNELLPETPLKQLPHVNDVFIRTLYEELDKLLIEPNFSVELLAQKVAMSQRTLNRKLKAILNCTPVEFIRRYRLQKAVMLISSGHNISDAAYSVGFDTASYFTQCFKDEFGKTPTEFLNQQTA